LVFEFLVDVAPFVLILGGLIAASWLFEKLGSVLFNGWEVVTWLPKALTYLGFFVGIVLLATAAVAWSQQVDWDLGTKYLLVVIGLALFLKPVKNFPIAALIGLTVGCACAAYVILFVPLPETVLGVSVRWVYLIVFLVPALITYLLFKFIEDALRLIRIVLTFEPVAIILGLVCIANGLLMLFGTSLFAILFPS
jgi:hypothetical protein